MAETVTMPKLGFDMAEGTLVRWVKAEGETVNKGEVLAEIETDKATVEVESNFSGVVAKQLVTQGSIVPVGDAIAVITEPGEKYEGGSGPGPVSDESKKGTAKPDEPVKEAIQTKAVETINTSGLPAGVAASPLARRLAADMGVDLKTVKGSGP
ncbi:MAG: E3 binding domain-containing protein, partial [Anaerolineae bacterium]|nr:E3 binding domain-containing protein [Anaerolineae bacterium]